MSIISNTVLAFSMSADAFAAAVSKGTSIKKPRLLDALKIGLVFGVVESITPLIGYALGKSASGLVESYDHWLAFTILAVIGGRMIFEGFGGDHEKKPKGKKAALLLTAFGTSIDSMAVGVGLAFISVNIWLMALMIGGATFLMATIGIIAGHWLGSRAGKTAEIVGGICLIAIGTKILLEHLHIIAV